MNRKSSSLPFCIALTLVAMLALATPSSAADKKAPGASSPAELPGGQCRAPIVGDLTRSELDQLSRVDRSLPGTWRREMKFDDPEVRTPMSGAGTVVSPKGPGPVAKSGNGRWLDGYRPSTPAAQAAYSRWLKQAGSGSNPEGLKGARSNQLPPQANLLNPGLEQTELGTEPTGYVVRTNVAAATVVDPSQVRRSVSAP